MLHTLIPLFGGLDYSFIEFVVHIYNAPHLTNERQAQVISCQRSPSQSQMFGSSSSIHGLRNHAQAATP